MLDWCDISAVIFSWASLNLKLILIVYEKLVLVILLSITYCNYLYVLQPRAVLQLEKTNVYCPEL